MTQWWLAKNLCINTQHSNSRKRKRNVKERLPLIQGANYGQNRVDFVAQLLTSSAAKSYGCSFWVQHNPQNPKYNQPSTLTDPLLFFFLLFRFFFFFFSLIIHTLFFLFFFISFFLYLSHTFLHFFSSFSFSPRLPGFLPLGAYFTYPSSISSMFLSIWNTAPPPYLSPPYPSLPTTPVVLNLEG